MHLDAINLTFSIGRMPKIKFGAGEFQSLPACIQQFGPNVLLVTGASSFIESLAWQWLQKETIKQNIKTEVECISAEPSPEQIDKIVQKYRANRIDVVVGIGGGSPLDAAKAIAGLLDSGNSVMDFIEGVGPELTYEGPAIPFIAVPTTAGTGSECTKNAVLSLQGRNGYKKSFRDECLIADYAIVDPELLISCPPSLIAANGMDALTQLLESYTSLRANRFTDALALNGLQAVKDSLLFWYDHAADLPEKTATTRYKMAYASMLSGITLAQVGLGSVHGLAAPLGAFFPIPHGVVCGTLVAEATAMNIKALRQREPTNTALIKYNNLAGILCDDPAAEADDLIQLLLDWTMNLELPELRHFGITQKDLASIVKHARGSSMQTNPILLTDDELVTILKNRL
jgi:alcohol dehydrogenase